MSVRSAPVPRARVVVEVGWSHVVVAAARPRRATVESVLVPVLMLMAAGAGAAPSLDRPVVVAVLRARRQPAAA